MLDNSVRKIEEFPQKEEVFSNEHNQVCDLMQNNEENTPKNEHILVDQIDQNNGNKVLKNEEVKSKSENEENVEIEDLSEEIINKKYNEYILKRQCLINEMQEMKYNGMNFTSEEERANKIFKKLVKNLKGQLSDSFYKEFTMKHKEMIEKTNIYKILKKMPKGANLHLHVDTAFDPDWV